MRAEVARGAPDVPSTMCSSHKKASTLLDPLSLSSAAPVDGFPAKFQNLHESSLCISLLLLGGHQDLPCV